MPGFNLKVTSIETCEEDGFRLDAISFVVEVKDVRVEGSLERDTDDGCEGWRF